MRARHVLSGQYPMVLRSPQDIARRVFELTGLDQLCVVE
jgi:anti-anti-sigma regulatory factor